MHAAHRLRHCSLRHTLSPEFKIATSANARKQITHVGLKMKDPQDIETFLKEYLDTLTVLVSH